MPGAPSDGGLYLGHSLRGIDTVFVGCAVFARLEAWGTWAAFLINLDSRPDRSLECADVGTES
eukprot:3715493-Amphidinium_carterae.1